MAQSSPALSTASPALVVTGGAPPGPRFRTPFGFLAALKRDPLGLLMSCREQYADFVCIRFPPLKTYAAFHPDHVQQILRDNHKNYYKGDLFHKFKRIAGEGLVFSDGELWKRQRQIVQPAFRRERVDRLAGMIVETTARKLEELEVRSREQDVHDLFEEISSLTLEIIASALFGSDFRDRIDSFSDAVTRGLEYADDLMYSFILPPKWLPTPSNLRGRRATRDLDQHIHALVEQRRAQGDRGDGPDLLSHLLAATRGENGAAAMDDKQLRDEMVTFLVAGHETTAVALAWTGYLVSRHRHVGERLEEEIDGVLGGRAPCLEDLPRLPYVRMVFEESMRLYPPAYATSRQAYEDDEVAGHTLRAGMSVTVSTYVTHRHPDFWPEPEHFDPERFTAREVAARHPMAYFPFGAGPRACVGRHFAMLEGQLILAMLLQRFRLRPTGRTEVHPRPMVTLRPAEPVRLAFEPRSTSPH
jgi:cytochrome P450